MKYFCLFNLYSNYSELMLVPALVAAPAPPSVLLEAIDASTSDVNSGDKDLLQQLDDLLSMDFSNTAGLATTSRVRNSFHLQCSFV